MSKSKTDFFEESKKYWNPHKTTFWQESGTDLVIDRREEYFLYDMDGARLIDLHLNGGTYNLGHRNPQVIEALVEGVQRFDIGNHHFPSLARTALAKRLCECTPGDLQYTVFASGGGEAIDIALKTARNATGRRKIVSVIKAYHGHTGLAVQTGDPRFCERFLCEDKAGDFIKVPFNDLEAMQAALSKQDVAAVIMESIPATYGFPMPADGYLETTMKMCQEHGSLYIADEVQTGLMRTGKLWCIEHHGIEPDILVTAKGLSGGIYPIAATVVSSRHAQWLHEDGFAHMSTFGGAELGCVVALKVLEITTSKDTVQNVASISKYIGNRLEQIKADYADFFVGIRQKGLVIGLEFDHPTGAMTVSKALYDNGIWAIFSTLDPRVLQFKPGLLCSQDLCNEILERVHTAIGQARNELF
jgi:acetylornithine/succinyldiaminopimelate/putrescine aminotransferase